MSERGELNIAATHFETAIRQGSPFEAYYYLADIQSRIARSSNVPHGLAASSCSIAVSFYKLVAERGVWDENLLREAELAWNTGTERGKEIALLKWWIAAERGIEVAQNNLAHILDQGTVISCCLVYGSLILRQTRAYSVSLDLHHSRYRTIRLDLR